MVSCLLLFCDGGVIAKNPSTYGGTWAWTLLDAHRKRVAYDSGVIIPNDWGRKSISNNFAELYAAIVALEAMPNGWRGILHTDSLVTVYRLERGVEPHKVHRNLTKRLDALTKNRKWKVSHIGGHPNKKALADGVDKRGLPVHEANVFCDQECKRQAELFMKRLRDEETGVKKPA